MPRRNFFSPGGGGGGGAEPGAGACQVEVDFGHAGGGEETLMTTAVAAPWVAEGTWLVCSPAGESTDDHDPFDAALDGVSAYAANVQPGVGFDLVVGAANGTWGRYLINVIGS
jgi:hypothetical protein